jgi:hypothetical protein
MHLPNHGPWSSILDELFGTAYLFCRFMRLLRYLPTIACMFPQCFVDGVLLCMYMEVPRLSSQQYSFLASFTQSPFHVDGGECGGGGGVVAIGILVIASCP